MSAPTITVKTIHELLHLEPSDDERTFTRLSNYEQAGLDSIVFAENE